MKHTFTNKQLLRLILPLLVEQLLAMLVGMFDTIMVSSVGEAAISGVSIVNDINNLIINLLAALAGGGAVCVSQYLGSGDNKNTQLSASQLVMISTLSGLGLGLVCLIFHKGILNILYGSVAPDVMQAARTYFWVTALSFPFLGLYNGNASIFRSMNKTKSTMYVSTLANIINLAGNYLGIFVFKMGVMGVALPTLVSRAVSGLIMFAMAFNKEQIISITIKDILCWKQKIISKILMIAIPNGIENGLFQFGKIIVSTFVATYGTSQIAANSVTNSISVLCYATEMAMQLAIVTVIGRCVGANDYDEARYYVRKMLILSAVLCVIDNIIVYLISPFGLSLFSLSEETLKIAKTILTMEVVACATLHTLAFCLPSCMRAAGDAKFTMMAGVFSMFAARVATAYILGTVMHYGVVGTRIGMYVDWVVRIGFFVWRYRSGKWQNYRLI